MPDQTLRRRPTPAPAAHPFRPVTALAVGAAAFTVLLTLVTAETSALRALDTSVSVELNELVAGSDAAVAVLRVVTDLGDPLVTAAVLTVLTVVLLIRRLPRLAGWVAVTGVGLAVLDPLVKGLVERDRPALPVAVANAPGYSFPSGHALASFATFTILLLVALPAIPPGRRRWAYVAAGTVIAAVGASRVALGVHYVSDVLAGWGLSAAWVATTALVLRARQLQQHDDPSRLREGPEPQAASALQPAPAPDRPLGPRPGRTLLLLAGGLAAVTALIAGLGLLLTEVLQDTWVGRFDRAAVQTLATLGAPWLDAPASLLNAIGGRASSPSSHSPRPSSLSRRSAGGDLRSSCSSPCSARSRSTWWCRAWSSAGPGRQQEVPGPPSPTWRAFPRGTPPPP